MRAIIVIGWKETKKNGLQPENLYTGTDGLAANAAAAEAQQKACYVKIGKLVNPSIIPLPIVPELPAK